ncbi:hypothetical protein OPV22_011819 [Ensete ventricosum]|uniref:Uncharacterized protein n=1 Tax=Ensete ventricosum TaxID=4639 RepID=A0AAV8RJY4_ENSVE|nr:hypothetical protein OPV22_011819 [Ensete ventricosum]
MEVSSPSPSRKRRRDEGEEESPEMSSPVAKRLLLDILDDDADPGDQDVASVMRSLEEEIALHSPLPHLTPQDAAQSDQPPDLGYLFEASDDELGLPPPAPSSSGDGSEAYNEEGFGFGFGFGQIWGFDEDLRGYDGFEFGIRPDERAEAEDGVVFDGGLFDYGEATPCGAPELADLSWRSETLPAV